MLLTETMWCTISSGGSSSLEVQVWPKIHLLSYIICCGVKSESENFKLFQPLMRINAVFLILHFNLPSHQRRHPPRTRQRVAPETTPSDPPSTYPVLVPANKVKWRKLSQKNNSKLFASTWIMGEYFTFQVNSPWKATRLQLGVGSLPSAAWRFSV